MFKNIFKDPKFVNLQKSLDVFDNASKTQHTVTIPADINDVEWLKDGQKLKMTATELASVALYLAGVKLMAENHGFRAVLKDEHLMQHAIPEARPIDRAEPLWQVRMNLQARFYDLTEYTVQTNDISRTDLLHDGINTMSAASRLDGETAMIVGPSHPRYFGMVATNPSCFQIAIHNTLQMQLMRPIGS